MAASVSFEADAAGTRAGELPPWESAKVVAFHVVLTDVAELLDSRAADLVGMRVDDYIAGKVFVKGGGHPCRTAVKKIIAKAKDPAWYPGKPARSSDGDKGGRPPVYSAHQKAEVARVAMELKRKLKAPTPSRVRARLPQICRNPETGEPLEANCSFR